MLSRVLVTGAAGLIGRAVLARCAAEDVPVTALVLEDPGDLKADRVVVGDAGDPEAVRRALEGVEAVIHLAAIPSPNDNPRWRSTSTTPRPRSRCSTGRDGPGCAGR